MSVFTVYVQDHSRPCILAVGGRKLPALLAKTYDTISANHAVILAQSEIDRCVSGPLVNAGCIWKVLPGTAQSTAIVHGLA